MRGRVGCCHGRDCTRCQAAAEVAGNVWVVRTQKRLALGQATLLPERETQYADTKQQGRRCTPANVSAFAYAAVHGLCRCMCRVLLLHHGTNLFLGRLARQCSTQDDFAQGLCQQRESTASLCTCVHKDMG